MAVDLFTTYQEISGPKSPFRNCSVRARKALARLGIGSIDELCRLTGDEFQNTKKVGITTRWEMERLLQSQGRAFGDGVIGELPSGFVIPKELSLRDWFAGQAASGMAENAWGRLDPRDTTRDVTEIATLSYAIADAMLAERSKEK